MSLKYHSEAKKKPRINYEVLIAKAKKKFNGLEKEKPVKIPEFEAASASHIYKGDQVAMRRLYSELVTKQNHNIDPQSFDLTSG